MEASFQVDFHNPRIVLAMDAPYVVNDCLAFQEGFGVLVIVVQIEGNGALICRQLTKVVDIALNPIGNPADPALINVGVVLPPELMMPPSLPSISVAPPFFYRLRRILVLDKTIWQSRRVRYLVGAWGIFCICPSLADAHKYNGGIHSDRLTQANKSNIWKGFLNGQSMSTAMAIHVGRVALFDALIARLRNGKGVGESFFVNVTVPEAFVRHLMQFIKDRSNSDAVRIDVRPSTRQDRVIEDDQFYTTSVDVSVVLRMDITTPLSILQLAIGRDSVHAPGKVVLANGGSVVNRQVFRLMEAAETNRAMRFEYDLQTCALTVSGSSTSGMQEVGFSGKLSNGLTPLSGPLDSKLYLLDGSIMYVVAMAAGPAIAPPQAARGDTFREL